MDFGIRGELEAVGHRSDTFRDRIRTVESLGKLGIMGAHGELPIWLEADID